MKVLRNRKWTSWLLVTAYVALLAHVFIPHHHHGEQTAFLDFKTCPHEQHDHVGHGHGDPDHPSHGQHTMQGDCETLKYVLIQDPQNDIPDTSPLPLLFLPDFTDSEQHLPLLPQQTGINKRSRPGSIPYTSYIALSQGMRAPPALS